MANFFALQKLAGHDIRVLEGKDDDSGTDETPGEMLQSTDSTSESTDNDDDSSTFLVRFTLYMTIHSQVN